MKPSDFKELIKSRHKARIKRPLLVESSPGVGKTQICAQSARELSEEEDIEGMKRVVGFKAIHAPLLQPEDYGLPVVSKDKTSVDFLVSFDKFPLEGSECEEEGIFLIDEISQADNSAQKILANLVQEREIHGKKLKDGWTVVATGNFQKDRAGANRILGHLGNRLTRVALEVSLDDWRQWAIQNDVPFEVISFISFRPALLSNYDPTNEINATPRSWVEGVGESLNVVPDHLRFHVFTGDVGEGPASEFLAFLKVFQKMPSPDAILLNPKKEKVPEDPATLYALCGALSQKSTQANFGRALTYVRRMPPEYSVLFVRDAMTKTPDVCNTKDYIDWASNEGAALLA